MISSKSNRDLCNIIVDLLELKDYPDEIQQIEDQMEKLYGVDLKWIYECADSDEVSKMDKKEAAKIILAQELDHTVRWGDYIAAILCISEKVKRNNGIYYMNDIIQGAYDVLFHDGI